MYQTDVVRLALERIGGNIGQEMNCETLAAQFHYSSYHFNRIFEHVAGMSVAEYIRNKRLEASAELLLDTDTSILEIALACGFNASQTYNRAFKSKYRITPREFRRNSVRLSRLSPAAILRKYYYQLAKGENKMLAPYVTERNEIRIIGKSVRLGGSDPSKDGIGSLFSKMDGLFRQITNPTDSLFYGVSIDFWHPDRAEDARRSYLLGKEVDSLTFLPHDMESCLIPVTRWLYIPIRYDDPFVRSLAPKEYENDYGYLTGCVFGWSRIWLEENGYERQDYPFDLEIYGLSTGHEGAGGAHLTLAVPMK